MAMGLQIGSAEEHEEIDVILRQFVTHNRCYFPIDILGKKIREKFEKREACDID